MGVARRDVDPARLREVFNARRTASGLTFEQLAEASGVSRQTLFNVASGRFRGDIVTWLRLAPAFEVSLDALFAPVYVDEDGPAGAPDPDSGPGAGAARA